MIIVPAFILFVAAVSFAAILSAVLKPNAASKPIQYRLVELLAAVNCFGIQMVLVFTKWQENGIVEVDRVIPWAIYLAVACLTTFFIAVDIFRRTDLQGRRAFRFVLVFILTLTSPIHVFLLVPTWLRWRKETKSLITRFLTPSDFERRD